jgi:hypothetical protein
LYLETDQPTRSEKRKRKNKTKEKRNRRKKKMKRKNRKRKKTKREVAPSFHSCKFCYEPTVTYPVGRSMGYKPLSRKLDYPVG